MPEWLLAIYARPLMLGLLALTVTLEMRDEIRLLQVNWGGMEKVPGLEGMVVVRFGNSVGKQFQDAEFLGLLTGATLR